MLRLVLAGGLAALLLPVAVWFGLVASAGFAFDRIPFQYQGQLAGLAFVFMLLLGLPWLRWLIKRRVSSYPAIAGLATGMGVLPFFVYLLVTVVAGPVPLWQGLYYGMAGFALYGWFCGSAIWMLGVFRNPLFSQHR